MRQLPVLATLKHAFESVWLNRMVALRMSWIWYIIVALVLAFSTQLTSSRGTPSPEEPQAGFFLVDALTLLLVLLVNSSFAVHWHRYILLDEVPS